MQSMSGFSARASETATALSSLDARIPEGSDADMVFAFYDAGHDPALISDFLRRRFPAAAIAAASSGGGLMADALHLEAQGVGLLLLDDPAGNYGAASAAFDDGPAEDLAEKLLHQALSRAGCRGQLPALIWVYQSPGREEAVLKGLRRIVGDQCPIFGGASADDDMSGRWSQIGPDGPSSEGLVVAALFPSEPVGFAFQGGYEPAGPEGVATLGQCGDSRTIRLIDGRPAAQVYDEWTGGALGDKLANGGPILSETALMPLGSDAGEVNGVRQYLLTHPSAVTAEQGLTTFRDLKDGDRVYAMRGDRRRLVDRAGRVTAQALKSLAIKSLSGRRRPVAGALMVYCCGCRTAVGDEIARAAGVVAENLGQAPLLGGFSFGEHGFLIDRNVHANLMISAIVFGRA
jgi:hypothetical protein